MKLKRPAVLASLSLLTLGGLYYGLFRPSDEIIGHSRVAHEPKAAPVILTRPTETAAVTPLPSNENPRDTEESVKYESADAGLQAGTAGPADKQTEPPATSGAGSLAADRKTRLPVDTPAVPIAKTEEESSRTPVGIRLAPDVRLPVAAMPNDLKLNPIKQKALQDIIDEYYQTVAAAVSAPASGAAAGMTAVAKNGGEPPAPSETTQPDAPLVVEENGEQTRVVTNSPTVDAARKRADLRFKALFGRAAYNRMTMNTLLESRLPLIKTEQ